MGFTELCFNENIPLLRGSRRRASGTLALVLLLQNYYKNLHYCYLLDYKNVMVTFQKRHCAGFRGMWKLRIMRSG